jgi:hypothetical protein
MNDNLFDPSQHPEVQMQASVSSQVDEVRKRLYNGDLSEETVRRARELGVPVPEVLRG